MGSHQWMKESWMHPLPQKWGILDTEAIVRRGIQAWDHPGALTTGDTVEGKKEQIKREGNKRYRNSKLEKFWRIFFVLHICTCNRIFYLHFTAIMLLLPPQFGHFPIQPTHLVIPRAEGVCQKLKVLPSLASQNPEQQGTVEAFTNTCWNLEKAAEPHFKGLIISQEPCLSCRMNTITLDFGFF